MEEEIMQADNLMRQGKSSLAVTIIKEEIKETPENSYLHYLLGIARMKCGRFFLAKIALEKANQLSPRHTENLRSLGWVKVMLGQLDEGRNDLREAIGLDLMNPLAYIDLAMSYFHYFDFKEGNEWLERGQSLAPKDPFILSNVKMMKEIEKDYLGCSANDLQEMRKEKLDRRVQLSSRISILESYSFKKPLTKDEAGEIREEARLNGLPISVVSEEDERKIIGAKNKSNSLKVKEILRKRNEIEKKLSNILKEINNPLTLGQIRDIIYREKNDNELTKIIQVFDRGQSIKELNRIFEIINDAWNYFPHKCLDGLCPMEAILKHNRTENQTINRLKKSPPKK
ncbi:MAG: hypothetical protein V1905_00675 [bacterium]